MFIIPIIVLMDNMCPYCCYLNNSYICCITILPNIVIMIFDVWICTSLFIPTFVSITILSNIVDFFSSTYIRCGMCVVFFCHKLTQNCLTVPFCPILLLSLLLSISEFLLILSDFFVIVTVLYFCTSWLPSFSRLLSSRVLAPPFAHCLLMHVRCN